MNGNLKVHFQNPRKGNDRLTCNHLGPVDFPERIVVDGIIHHAMGPVFFARTHRSIL